MTCPKRVELVSGGAGWLWRFVSRRITVLPRPSVCPGRAHASRIITPSRVVPFVDSRIEHAIARRHELERDVSARYGRVGEPQGARGARPDEGACGAVRVENGRLPGVWPLDDDQPKHLVRRPAGGGRVTVSTSSESCSENFGRTSVIVTLGRPCLLASPPESSEPSVAIDRRGRGRARSRGPRGSAAAPRAWRGRLGARWRDAGTVSSAARPLLGAELPAAAAVAPRDAERRDAHGVICDDRRRRDHGDPGSPPYAESSGETTTTTRSATRPLAHAEEEARSAVRRERSAPERARAARGCCSPLRSSCERANGKCLPVPAGPRSSLRRAR